MIDIKPYQPAEVVPRSVIEEWQQKIRTTVSKSYIPDEVQAFIDSLAAKMPDFGRVGTETFMYSGQTLLLSGMKQFKGEPVDPIESYSIEFPKMQAVDHRSIMIRLYHKKGKQGLIDYVKARLTGTRLARTLKILTVEVFQDYSQRGEYQRMMGEIKSAQKLESEFE